MGGVNKFGQTQKWSIYDQLKHGVRYLDIRPSIDGWIYHGKYPTKYKFTQVLNEVSRFLRSHPSETVIMSISKEHSSESNVAFTRYFNKIRSKYPKLFYITSRITTLGQVRGKIWPIIDFVYFGNAFRWKNNPKLHLQDKYEWQGERRKKRYILQHLKESQGKPNQIHLNHFSASVSSLKQGLKSLGATPKGISKKMNRLMFKINQHKFLGICVFDFPTEKLIRRVYLRNLK